MDEHAAAQVQLIHAVLGTLRAVEVPAWLFGGWGLDALLGRVTRPHRDIELWLERGDIDRSKEALVRAGAVALSTQPPEESCEFTWDDVQFSTAYFGRRPDRTITLEGRWSDWRFPVGAFGDEVGVLDGVAVPTMSVAGMIAMKEQYPSLPNGRPLRAKDEGDLAVLRALLPTSG